MSETKELAVTTSSPQTAVYIPSVADWDFMLKWGERAVRSGMLPSAIRTPEAAAIIVLKGRELGIPFMTAIANVHVINGKPSMSAELIQGLARKNLPSLVMNILESDSKIAKIEFIREKGAKPFIQSFSWEDAERAKLTNKDVWKQYPAAMLWSRCVTAGLRKVCPEALMGVSYTPEELGANVDQDGNVVIETTGRKVEEPKAPIAPIQPKQPTAEELAAIERKKMNHQIKDLKLELDLTDQELKEEVHRRFGTDDSSKLTLDQLENVKVMLESEKSLRAREKPAAPSEPQPQFDAGFDK